MARRHDNPFNERIPDQSLSPYEITILVAAMLITVIAAILVGLGLHMAIQSLGHLT